jgi:enoyl-CoA hydratase
MSIDYEQDGHVVTITINRPEAHNSLDMEHFRNLLGAWTRFRDDESAWVAVVTGTGKAFCTGPDLKSFIPELTGTLERPDGWDRMDALHAVLHRFPIYKPIVAAVNGVCVAGGMEMLGSTDIRVATPDARFAVMEPKRGLFAGGGTTVRLLRQIAYPHAMELLLTADMIDAERALTMGLLNRVVPPDELMPAAYDYARRIAENAPLAVFATKQSAIEGLSLGLEEAFDNEAHHTDRVFATEDAKEGPRAFAEKPPRSGRAADATPACPGARNRRESALANAATPPPGCARLRVRPVGRRRPVLPGPLARVIGVEAGGGVAIGAAGGDGGGHPPVVHLVRPATDAAVLVDGDAGEVERPAGRLGVVTPVLHVDHDAVPVDDVPLVDGVELRELLVHQLRAPGPELGRRLAAVVVVDVHDVVGVQGRLRSPVLPHRADPPQVPERLLHLGGSCSSMTVLPVQ